MAANLRGEADLLSLPAARLNPDLPDTLRRSYGPALATLSRSCLRAYEGLAILAPRERDLALGSLGVDPGNPGESEERAAAEYLGADIILQVELIRRGKELALRPRITRLHSRDSFRGGEVTLGLMDGKPVKAAGELCEAWGELLQNSGIAGADRIKLAEGLKPVKHFTFSSRAFEAYARGLERERALDFTRALNYYTICQKFKDSPLDCDFRHFRLLYRNFSSRGLQKGIRTIRAKLRRFRRGSGERQFALMNFSRTLFRMGEFSLAKRKLTSARFLFKTAGAIYRQEARGDSFWYIRSLAARARSLDGRTRLREAPGYNSRARKLFEAAGYDSSVYYVETLINQGALYEQIEGAKSERAEQAYLRAEKTLRRMDAILSLPAAMLYHNRGVLYRKRGDTQAAREEFIRALEVFRGLGAMNSRQYLHTLLNYANLTGGRKTRRERIEVYKKIFTAARMLGLTESRVYAAAMHNRAALLGARPTARDGKVSRKARARELKLARRLFDDARKLYRRLALHENSRASRKRDRGIHQLGCLDAADRVYRGDTGLTAFEEWQIGTYTGAYKYTRHSAAVQARTYNGRHEDTRVFLADLLNAGKNDSLALNRLRKNFLGTEFSRDGREINFIDIGPAVANRRIPAATSVTIAKSFKKMNVVAFDLPEQVERYVNKVPAKAKRRLQSHKNIHIFAGNGLAPLLTQFRESKNWLLKDRSYPRFRGCGPVVIRAANSIDIYAHYWQVRPGFREVGREFKCHPVLYFFNRSLLFKPRDKTRFHMVGYVSVRGFHHNTVSFDRGGEPAYSLPGL